MVGRQIKPKYERYVDLKNKKAQLNGFKDYGDQWRSRYELENFEDMIIGMWNDLEPLYKELHAYIRYRLSMVYGKVTTDGFRGNGFKFTNVFLCRTRSILRESCRPISLEICGADFGPDCISMSHPTLTSPTLTPVRRR